VYASRVEYYASSIYEDDILSSRSANAALSFRVPFTSCSCMYRKREVITNTRSGVYECFGTPAQLICTVNTSSVHDAKGTQHHSQGYEDTRQYFV